MAQQWDLINEKKNGKLAKCWLAATLSSKTFHRKFKTQTINDIDVCQMCGDIEDIIEGRNGDAAYGKFNLYLSSQLTSGAIKIFSYQTSNLEKELIDIEKLLLNTRGNERVEERYHERAIDLLDVLSTHSAQLHEDVNLLPDESDIEIKFRNKMNDAACLEFGALTEEEMASIHLLDADISLEMLERTHTTNPNIASGLEISFDSEKNLAGMQEFNIDISENQKKISISSIHDDLHIADEEHRTDFSKKELLEVPTLGMESRKSDLLTPQKRQSSKEKYMETPSKRRRLRFGDESDIDKIVTVPMPEPVVVAIPATDHSLVLSHDLELPQKNSLEIERKLRKKKVFADKNTKLNHKTIRTWLDNINAHTTPLSIYNVNMPMSEILFKTPSASFTSVYQRKWNNSLNALYHTHTIALSGKKIIPVEYAEPLDKSTEFTRFGDRSDKTEGPSDLTSVLGKSLVSHGLTKSATIELEQSTFLQKEWYKEKPLYDSQQDVALSDTVEGVDLINLEQTLGQLNIEQSKHSDLKTHEEAKEEDQENLKPYQSCPLTKQELLALFEIHWCNAEIVQFTDVIHPDDYNRNDAACCYIFLLELHKEKKITLEQATPYNVLWVRKYSGDMSESDSME